MIIQNRDWRSLIIETGDDLRQWHPDIETIDWSATLAQPNWTLLTDRAGSWCLLHPTMTEYSASQHLHLEAHLIISPDHRGSTGIEIARAMLEWIDRDLAPLTLMAKAPARATRLFLRWLGFAEVEAGRMEFTMNSAPQRQL